MFAPIMMDYLCSNVWVFYALFTSREMWDIKICRFFSGVIIVLEAEFLFAIFI